MAEDDDDRTLVIDCTECLEGAGEEHREECIVAFIVDRPPGAVVFDVAEARALRSLRDGGLLPGVRLERKTG